MVPQMGKGDVEGIFLLSLPEEIMSKQYRQIDLLFRAIVVDVFLPHFLLRRFTLQEGPIKIKQGRPDPGYVTIEDQSSTINSNKNTTMAFASQQERCYLLQRIYWGLGDNREGPSFVKNE